MDQENDTYTPEEEHEGILRQPAPFEDPSKDMVSGFIETMKLVLLKPNDFYSRYKMDGSIGKPLLFAVIIGMLAAIADIIWGLATKQSLDRLFQELLSQIEGFFQEHLFQIEEFEKFVDLLLGGGATFIGLIIAPIFIVIGLFIAAGITHLFLLIVKGANRNFETTFNVIAYSTASKIAHVLPFVGGIIAFIYGLVLAVIGLTEAHETENWKAIFAQLAPLALCCICCIVIAFAVLSLGILPGAMGR
ncbi:MAG: hypothetical protein GY757_22790 [bacterium]|nr:hypothetical protein [bacterium]